MMLGNKLLQGERLYLTAITREDIPTIAQWFSDLELLYTAAFRAIFPSTPENELALYEQRRNTGNLGFAIRLLENDELIGICSLTSPDWHNRLAMMGISIGEAQNRGKGYGVEATRVLLRYAFLELNLHRVELGVFEFNERALKTYEKIGFKHEVCRRKAFFRDGKYHNIYYMALLQHEWADNV